MTLVSEGDKVGVRYRAFDHHGNLLAQSGVGSVFVVAGGQDSIRGLSQGVVGLEQGDKRVLKLLPQDTFGGANTAALRLIDYSQLPDNLKPGDLLRLGSEDQFVFLWVAELQAYGALLCTQHPLAGKRLELHVEIVSVGAFGAIR